MTTIPIKSVTAPDQDQVIAVIVLAFSANPVARWVYPMFDIEANSEYHELIIVGASSGVAIWLGDDEGHFVQRGIGTLTTSLLSGHYRVEFGLGSPQYPIELAGPSRYSQEQVEASPSCPRIVPTLLPES